MKPRSGYNPKRKIAAVEETTVEQRQFWAQRISYGGNPEHKRTPGDYGLTPPRSPRPMKTLCDGVGPLRKADAETLLREGVRKGLVSRQQRNEWPQNIWAVSSAGTPFEAQLENSGQGRYHGYPLAADDDFRRVVLEEWERRR